MYSHCTNLTLLIQFTEYRPHDIPRMRARSRGDDLVEGGPRERSTAEETGRKRSADRESPADESLSRRYRPIWTRSPACSEHVYLWFRVSISRHCARFSLLLLSHLRRSSPHRRCIDIAEARTASVPLNGTFVDPPERRDNRAVVARTLSCLGPLIRTLSRGKG